MMYPRGGLGAGRMFHFLRSSCRSSCDSTAHLSYQLSALPALACLPRGAINELLDIWVQSLHLEVLLVIQRQQVRAACSRTQRPGHKGAP
jgi:hypothetical protein